MSKLSYRTTTQLWHAAIIVLIGIVCIIFVIPLILIVSASFTETSALANTGYRLIPPVFSTEAYQFLLVDPSLVGRAYGVSVFVTAVGTSVGILIMSMLAFVLSRREFRLRGLLTFYVFFTMLFNGGLVPYYITITRTLHLKNTVWAMILPYLVVPFFVLLLRTYFLTLPKDLFDAAKIDGADDWRVFYRIVVPLSTPAILTVALFLLLQYWNDMYQALLFIEGNSLSPLQYTLYKMIANMSQISELATQVGKPVPALSVRMAMAVLALGPILLAFLFVQRYFVRGITLGGIKGD